MMNNTRIRKSERLSKEEHQALTDAGKDFSTMVDFAEKLGLNRCTLSRILEVGSAAPVSIKKIRSYLEGIAV